MISCGPPYGPKLLNRTWCICKSFGSPNLEFFAVVVTAVLANRSIMDAPSRITSSNNRCFWLLLFLNDKVRLAEDIQLLSTTSSVRSATKSSPWRTRFI